MTRFGSESTVSGVPAKHSEVARRDGYAADGKRPHRRRIGADVRPSWAPNDRIVLEPERQKLTGFGRAWWHQLEKQGRAPKRIKLGDRRVAWLLSELEAWLRERAAARDAGGDDARPA